MVRPPPRSTLVPYPALFRAPKGVRRRGDGRMEGGRALDKPCGDRKSTRLNSSHVAISYAVFCLKKKNPERDRLARRAHSARGHPGHRRRFRTQSPELEVGSLMWDGFILYVIGRYLVFFFVDRATTEIYTLSVHDPLPI